MVRWLARAVAVTALLLGAGYASAGAFNLGNCGSTYWQRSLLRDSWGKASFSQSCVNHDRCYDTCNSGKAYCDKAFKNDMYAACKRAYGGRFDGIQRSACETVADSYYSAVNRLAGDAYRDSQKKACRR